MRFINAPSIRNVPNIGWQIMLEDEQWYTCRQEIDARFIANGVAIANSVIRGERAGEEVARELDQAAASVSRHIGACDTGTLIAAAAAHARLDASSCNAIVNPCCSSVIGERLVARSRVMRTASGSPT